MNNTAKLLMGAAGAAVASYAGYVAWTYARYGRPDRKGRPDPLMDRFMPEFDVREQHRIAVRAPLDVTFAAARQINLQQSPVARAIFAVRSLPSRLMAAAPPPKAEGLVDAALELGWGVLADTTGQIVIGGVTQPWLASPTFRALAPEDFAAFKEPGYVKIVWTIAVDPVDEGSCIARTETRAQPTDPVSREKFRRYWAALSPGILLIRRESLNLVKQAAEHRRAPVPAHAA